MQRQDGSRSMAVFTAQWWNCGAIQGWIFPGSQNRIAAQTDVVGNMPTHLCNTYQNTNVSGYVSCRIWQLSTYTARQRMLLCALSQQGMHGSFRGNQYQNQKPKFYFTQYSRILSFHTCRQHLHTVADLHAMQQMLDADKSLCFIIF